MGNKIDIRKVVRGLSNFKVSLASDIEDPKDFVSTGNLSFDLQLDGGIPFGYVSEFMGFSQSGKSLFIQQVIANAMKEYNATGILIDRENAYTKKRGTQLGIDNDALVLAKPKDTPTPLSAFSFIIQTVEAIRKAEETHNKNAKKKEDKIEPSYIAIGIDSISSFGKDVDLDKSDSGRKAKSIHEGLRELLSIMDNRTMLMIANQFTFKIGVMFGDPRTTTAGEAIKYYGNIRLALQDVKRIKDARRNNEVVGNWITAEVVKTRLGPCYRKISIQHLYSTGIDYYSGYARMLVNRGYLNPKNKEEFKKFNQNTVVYGEGDDKQVYRETAVDQMVADHPELLFTNYPEYNLPENEKNEEKEEAGADTKGKKKSTKKTAK